MYALKKNILLLLQTKVNSNTCHIIVIIVIINFLFLFFSIWVFFHNHLQITGLQAKGEGISLAPHYQFHSLHRLLDINWAITAETSTLRIGSSSRTRTFYFRAQGANH